MTTDTQVTPLAIEDYEAIESAVMETSRGRWFLAEYARRNRNSDTDAILTALDRMERTMRRDRAAPDIDRIRLDLADMAEAISRTKQEIAQMKLDTEHGGRFADASHELDAIVSQTETATNEILRAAEHVQEVAWTLREAGSPDELCDKLDTEATEIYTACSFQDLTGQRTRKVVTVLRYLESRINAMMSIWGLEEVEDLPVAAPDFAPDPSDVRPDAHLLNGPQLHGRGVDQGTVDDLMWSEADLAVAEQVMSEEPPAFASIDEPSPAFADAEVPVFAADEPPVFAPVEPPVFAADEPAPAEAEIEIAALEADVFAPAAEPAAATPRVEDEIDLSRADVFSSEATDRLAATVRERREVVEDEDETVGAAEPTPVTAAVAVGNTLRTVAVEAAAQPAADAAPALAVVEVEDQIAALSPQARLVTFG
jgi:chemotaxis regulatin CheY-phosphate phosphatase CheZ